MSVYLKPGQLKIKDENGDYTGINTVALESTAEYLAEIETKGDQIMDDIETKGEETLESIPDDYTALSNEVDGLNERIDNLNPITDDIKEALLACFEHVAWIDEHGQDYYDDLYSALYNEEPPVPTDILYKLTQPVYSNGSNSIDTGVKLQQNNGKYTICMKFIIPVDTPTSEGRSIFSMKYENSGGNYYNIAILKRQYTTRTVRMMYGSGLPWDDTTSLEGKYILGAVYSIVLVIDTDSVTSKLYVYDTQREYSYDKTLNAGYLFNNQSIVLGKEAYEGVDGFTGMISDVMIKKGEFTDTEITNYFNADVEKENIVFEIGDVSASTGENLEQPLRIRSKGYIEVSGSIVTSVGCPFAKTWYDYNHNAYSPYDIYSVHAFRCYDSAKSYLGNVSMITNNQIEETSMALPTGTKYIRVIMQKGGPDSYTTGFSANATFPYYINNKSYRLTEV